jgi:hypothetical protein
MSANSFFDGFVDENGRPCKAIAVTTTVRVPPGWALVPLEPTRHMMESAPALPAIVESDLRLRRLGWSLQACQNRRRYLAMLAAAPKPGDTT